MMSITKVSSNRVDVEFSGKIDREQMTKVLDDMFAAIADMENGLLMYHIGELEMPTMGAIAVELKNLPKIFRLVQKIDRIAVVCDQGWIQTATEIEGKLIPGLKMKSFDLNKENAAIEWLEA
jgi:hypothetical protein